MIKFHKCFSYRGLIDVCVNKDEKVSITNLMKALSEDLTATLEIETIKKIKGKEMAKLKAFEIKKGHIRIFFTYIDEGICIVYATRKQKNKTETNDLKVVKQRLKTVHN